MNASILKAGLGEILSTTECLKNYNGNKLQLFSKKSGQACQLLKLIEINCMAHQVRLQILFFSHRTTGSWPLEIP